MVVIQVNSMINIIKAQNRIVNVFLTENNFVVFGFFLV